ncbi:MAG: non-structural maintenance of chromosomes element 1 family protein [Asgard group archaeon]|nr:non-structural maintenance of chromosomes element 1 family protein [Asgard group archaeon]
MYTEAHRLLLTYIRSVRYIESSHLLRSFAFILEQLEITDRPLKDLLDHYIADINLKISPQSFKVERKNHELTGDLYYIFINTLSDDIIMESSIYSTPELTAIKLIIHGIVEAENYHYYILKSGAELIISSNTSKTLQDSAVMVDRLIDDGWFTSTLDLLLLLSIRTLCELKQYLIETYGVDNNSKVLLCPQCKEIVTIGWLTPSEESFHRKCYDVYCRTNRIDADESQLVRIGPEPSTL